MSAGRFAVTIDGVEVAGAPGASLFECAEVAGVPVPTSCVKQGNCRECLVELEEGGERLTPLTEPESHLGGLFRLSCQARLTGVPGPVRAHTLRRGTLRIEGESYGVESGHRRWPLEPAAVRRGTTLLLDGIAAGEIAAPPLGLAIDLGTTTVAVRLYDLESGARLAASSFENPQRFGGSDVLARVRYDGEHRGRLLQRTLLAYLSKVIQALPCDPREIVEVVVAGNPTMRDLFFGLDVSPIGVLPYRSVTETAWREGRSASTAISAPARKLRLPLHPAARVIGLPLIASHVGADAAASLLATGLAEEAGPAALLDIGTNTELVVAAGGRIVAASCPAGPAFEGGGVTHGMPALDGAIERVKLGEAGSAEPVAALSVIGGGEPAGICGSGLVDLLSELLRTGRMNEQGRLADEASEIVVDAARNLAVSEADINELAQAKGANVAGFRIAISALGLGVDELARVDLAGGFARHLDLDAARRIGLVPDLPEEKLRQVGNASLEGASIALLSRPAREALEAIVARIEHVRLEADPGFFDAFVEGCQFKPWGGAAG